MSFLSYIILTYFVLVVDQTTGHITIHVLWLSVIVIVIIITIFIITSSRSRSASLIVAVLGGECHLMDLIIQVGKVVSINPSAISIR